MTNETPEGTEDLKPRKPRGRPPNKNRAATYNEVHEKSRLYMTQDGRCFVEFDNPEGGLPLMYMCDGTGKCEFARWFASYYWKRNEEFAPAEFIASVSQMMLFNAEQHGKKLQFGVRVMGSPDEIYVDGCALPNEALVVTANGLDTKPIGDAFRFIRARDSQTWEGVDLSAEANELLEALKGPWQLDKMTWHMLAAWLLGGLRPGGPYPILMLTGEQGSGKSTMARTLKKIIDPQDSDMRVLPDDFKDLIVAVNNSFVLAYDNVSSLRHKLSDQFCMLATGTASFGGRTLYTNMEETYVRAARPILLNGIPDVMERGDIIDRAIHIHMPSIALKDRIDDQRYWQWFEKSLSKIRGALLKAASAASQGYQDVVLAETPRMSAFATWVVAAEEALGFEKGLFLSTYANNRRNAEMHLAEFNSVSSALQRLLEKERQFSGLYEELMSKLVGYLGPGERLPATSNAFAAELKRLVPVLTSQGIKVYNNGRRTHGHGKGRTLIEIRQVGDEEKGTERAG